MVLKGNTFFSNLFFTWIQPVLTFGAKNILEQKDIPKLDEKMRSVVEVEVLEKHLEKEFRKEKKNSEGMSLLKAMFAATKHLTIPIMITAFIAVGISMSIPYVTQIIIAYISSGKKELSKGIMYISGILVLKFVQNVAESRMYYNLSIIGYNLCNTISVCIFEKASRYPTLCSKKYTVAELINYSQVDAQRLT
jgi:ABC-type bacteriocin/lantibiotic exporter with double-glycine peptidase domain